MRASSLVEEYKSVIGDRKLKVILQAVFEKKIRPPALQQCLVHSLLDRTLGATKQWRRNVFTSDQVSASWIVLWRRRLWIRLLISSGDFFFLFRWTGRYCDRRIYFSSSSSFFFSVWFALLSSESFETIGKNLRSSCWYAIFGDKAKSVVGGEVFTVLFSCVRVCRFQVLCERKGLCSQLWHHMVSRPLHPIIRGRAGSSNKLQAMQHNPGARTTANRRRQVLMVNNKRSTGRRLRLHTLHMDNSRLHTLHMDSNRLDTRPMDRRHILHTDNPPMVRCLLRGHAFLQAQSLKLWVFLRWQTQMEVEQSTQRNWQECCQCIHHLVLAQCGWCSTYMQITVTTPLLSVTLLPQTHFGFFLNSILDMQECKSSTEKKSWQMSVGCLGNWMACCRI
jgi:hypothetical protein